MLRVMNPVTPGQPYQPTSVEHLANVITHAVPIYPACVAHVDLVSVSSSRKLPQFALLYSASLIVLFMISTAYHIAQCLHDSGFFRNCTFILDRAVIHFFIAATYSPWLCCRCSEDAREQMLWIVWSLAFVGMLYQCLLHTWLQVFDTHLYIITGIMPAFSVFTMQQWTGLPEMIAGGLLYIIGLHFYGQDGSVPMAHAIWHVHVIFGVAVHYHAFRTYLVLAPQGDDGLAELRQTRSDIVMTAS
uniref:Monocyte to macrophage differentiation protein n=1 Tax=Trichuris muris TaxID=70415 RepID=A0A5S6Q8K9_TRIMR